MKVVIAGGGIGGLTTALTLHKCGFDVSVYEAVQDIRPLGVGLNILPHGVKVLEGLGLLDELVNVAIQTQDLYYFDKFGSEIWHEPKGIAAGFGYPQLAIRRGDLHMILLKAVTERLGADRVITGHPITGFQHMDDGRVVASFKDRRNGDRPVDVTTDVLVGADGIHSAVRAQLYPNEGPPHWAGQLIWRGVTEADPFLTGKTMIMAGPSATKFIAYPVSQQHLERGRALINWIAEITVDPSQGFRKEDWNRQGKLEDFMPIFEHWNFGWIDVPGIIRNAEKIHEFPMVDRDPLERWSYGGVTLLGDAAHPMYPNGSSGASSAILDALALAEALERNATVEAALKAYERERLPATRDLVILNRRRGPEEVLELAEQRAPNGFTNIEDVIPRAELEEIAERYRQVSGFYFAREASQSAAAAGV